MNTNTVQNIEAQGHLHTNPCTLKQCSQKPQLFLEKKSEKDDEDDWDDVKIWTEVMDLRVPFELWTSMRDDQLLLLWCCIFFILASASVCLFIMSWLSRFVFSKVLLFLIIAALLQNPTNNTVAKQLRWKFGNNSLRKMKKWKRKKGIPHRLKTSWAPLSKVPV